MRVCIARPTTIVLSQREKKLAAGRTIPLFRIAVWMMNWMACVFGKYRIGDGTYFSTPYAGYVDIPRYETMLRNKWAGLLWERPDEKSTTRSLDSLNEVGFMKANSPANCPRHAGVEGRRPSTLPRGSRASF